MGFNDEIHLSPGLQKFLTVVVGMQLPEGSPRKLWEMGDAYKSAAEEIEESALQLRGARDELDDSFDGEAGDASVDYLNTMLGYLSELQTSAEELYKTTTDTAANIQKGRILFITMLVLAFIEVMALLASIVLSWLAPAVTRAAQEGLKRILLEMIKDIARSAPKYVMTVPNAIKNAGGLGTRSGVKAGLQAGGRQAWNAGKYPLGGAAFGAGVLGIVDGSVQQDQIDDNRRTEFDEKSFTATTVGGAIGGAFAGLASNLSFGAIRSVRSAMDAINKPIRDFNEKIASFNAKAGTNFATAPEKQLTGGQNAFGKVLDGLAQAGSTIPANLVINAVFDEHAGATDGLFSAFARGAGGSGEASANAAKIDVPKASEIDGPPELKIPSPDSASTGGDEGDTSISGETLRGDVKSTDGSDFTDSDSLHSGDEMRGSDASGTDSGGKGDGAGSSGEQSRSADPQVAESDRTATSRQVESGGNPIGTMFSNSAPVATTSHGQPQPQSVSGSTQTAGAEQVPSMSGTGQPGMSESTSDTIADSSGGPDLQAHSSSGGSLSGELSADRSLPLSDDDATAPVSDGIERTQMSTGLQDQVLSDGRSENVQPGSAVNGTSAEGGRTAQTSSAAGGSSSTNASNGLSAPTWRSPSSGANIPVTSGGNSAESGGNSGANTNSGPTTGGRSTSTPGPASSGGRTEASPPGQPPVPPVGPARPNVSDGDRVSAHGSRPDESTTHPSHQNLVTQSRSRHHDESSEDVRAPEQRGFERPDPPNPAGPAADPKARILQQLTPTINGIRQYLDALPEDTLPEMRKHVSSWPNMLENGHFSRMGTDELRDFVRGAQELLSRLRQAPMASDGALRAHGPALEQSPVDDLSWQHSQEPTASRSGGEALRDAGRQPVRGQKRPRPRRGARDFRPKLPPIAEEVEVGQGAAQQQGNVVSQGTVASGAGQSANRAANVANPVVLSGVPRSSGSALAAFLNPDPPVREGDAQQQGVARGSQQGGGDQQQATGHQQQGGGQSQGAPGNAVDPAARPAELIRDGVISPASQLLPSRGVWSGERGSVHEELIRNIVDRLPLSPRQQDSLSSQLTDYARARGESGLLQTLSNGRTFSIPYGNGYQNFFLKLRRTDIRPVALGAEELRSTPTQETKQETAPRQRSNRGLSRKSGGGVVAGFWDTAFDAVAPVLNLRVLPFFSWSGNVVNSVKDKRWTVRERPAKLGRDHRAFDVNFQLDWRFGALEGQAQFDPSVRLAYPASVLETPQPGPPAPAPARHAPVALPLEVQQLIAHVDTYANVGGLQNNVMEALPDWARQDSTISAGVAASVDSALLVEESAEGLVRGVDITHRTVYPKLLTRPGADWTKHPEVNAHISSKLRGFERIGPVRDEVRTGETWRRMTDDKMGKKVSSKAEGGVRARILADLGEIEVDGFKSHIRFGPLARLSASSTRQESYEGRAAGKSKDKSVEAGAQRYRLDLSLGAEITTRPGGRATTPAVEVNPSDGAVYVWVRPADIDEFEAALNAALNDAPNANAGVQQAGISQQAAAVDAAQSEQIRRVLDGDGMFQDLVSMPGAERLQAEAKQHIERRLADSGVDAREVDWTAVDKKLNGLGPHKLLRGFRGLIGGRARPVNVEVEVGDRRFKFDVTAEPGAVTTRRPLPEDVKFSATRARGTGWKTTFSGGFGWGGSLSAFARTTARDSGYGASTYLGGYVGLTGGQDWGTASGHGVDADTETRVKYSGPADRVRREVDLHMSVVEEHRTRFWDNVRGGRIIGRTWVREPEVNIEVRAEVDYRVARFLLDAVGQGINGQ
ncbi:hypothetical protein, partial [Saccharopolyspora sp. NPDC002686]|uniref:WXG100-like domain-containing protein n=1 Tax=Saccharopolyspora sp. NPDC002686 TaxID=3154541 RepID=UPI00332C79D3